MNYRLYFDAIQCDKWCCNLIRACDLGIEAYGTPITISFTTSTKPTDEYIEKMIKQLSKTEEEKRLNVYYANVKLNRIEVVK